MASYPTVAAAEEAFDAYRRSTATSVAELQRQVLVLESQLRLRADNTPATPAVDANSPRRDSKRALKEEVRTLRSALTQAKMEAQERDAELAEVRQQLCVMEARFMAASAQLHHRLDDARLEALDAGLQRIHNDHRRAASEGHARTAALDACRALRSALLGTGLYPVSVLPMAPAAACETACIGQVLYEHANMAAHAITALVHDRPRGAMSAAADSGVPRASVALHVGSATKSPLMSPRRKRPEYK